MSNDGANGQWAMKVAAWLRDTDAGRELLAKAAARLCRTCTRVQKLLNRCDTCQYRQQDRTTSEILDQLPPHSWEAEQGVVGSVLLLPAVYREIKPALEPQDFYSLAHEILWRRIREILEHQEPLDVMLLSERLRRCGEWEQVGGSEYIAEVLHSVAVPSHAKHYAIIVRQKAVLRRMIATLLGMLQSCYSDDLVLSGGMLADSLDVLAERLRKGRLSYEQADQKETKIVGTASQGEARTSPAK